MPDRVDLVISDKIDDSPPVRSTFLDVLGSRAMEDSEKLLEEFMKGPIQETQDIGRVDIVVGIPFFNEVDTITSVIRMIREGLEEFYPGQKSLIVAVGSPHGGDCLGIIRQIPQSETIRHISFLLNDEKVNGKGWAVRAIMRIAQLAGADLALIEADLKSKEHNGEIVGLSPEWIHLLIEPLKRERMDLVISKFYRHYLETPISTQVIYPLLTAIYNCPVHDAIGGQWGISNRLLRIYLQEPFYRQSSEIGGFGIDVWVVTKAAANNARICESNLGIKVPGTSGKMELMLHHSIETLFERIIADREWWVQEETAAATPLLRTLSVFGTQKTQQPERVYRNAQKLLSNYRRGFNNYHKIYSSVLTNDLYLNLEDLIKNTDEDFNISDSLWTGIVYHFLLAFAFNREIARGDLINAFIPLFEGRLSGFTSEVQSLHAEIPSLPRREVEELVSLEANSRINSLTREFILQKQDFLAKWCINADALKPPVPKVTYREFIPGVHLVVPLEVRNPEGYPVSANAIYESVFSRYKAEFEKFIYDELEVPRNADSTMIVQRVYEFMIDLEEKFDTDLLPGDLSTVEGTFQIVNNIINYCHKDNTFSLGQDAVQHIISRNLPYDLLTRLGYSDLSSLLNKYQPNDILALANWSEEPEYQEWVLNLLRDTLEPEYFEVSRLQPVVVDHEQFPTLVEMRECGGLCKLTGRIVVSNLRKGTGGQFPKIRYFTTIAKAVVEIERFGGIWRRWAGDNRNLGEKVVNSIEGHWGREPLSAHNIFENGHHRLLIRRLSELAEQIIETAGGDKVRLELADILQKAIDSYHLAITLPDGVFVPCSAWSWASYSFKGGVGLPTPFSLNVERDWSSRDFLTEYYKATGGEEEAIDEKIAELMGQGKESSDLASVLLGTSEEADAIIQMELIPPQQPPAGALVRYDGNPILRPIKEHAWESRYVLNPGAIRLGHKVYLVYRAFGEDNVSRLGLAISDDGFKFSERLDTPIFEPANRNEEKGCEDARLTLIGDRIFMLYTAYSNMVTQIGMASIEEKDFLDYNWQGWRRHGMVFPGFSNKDGALFTEQFGDKYAMLHRVDPHIWITFSSHLHCPWPRSEHKILAGSTYGMLWDGKKIGGGSQPIKTKFGWLLITHGVDYLRFYRLGVLLLDLVDPTVVIYRSPNAILEPVEKYEEGEPGKDWVPNVVFTCGAVPRENKKDILEANDELLVYYGAADSVIGVATAKISDLIPGEFRH